MSAVSKKPTQIVGRNPGCPAHPQKQVPFAIFSSYCSSSYCSATVQQLAVVWKFWEPPWACQHRPWWCHAFDMAPARRREMDDRCQAVQAPKAQPSWKRCLRAPKKGAEGHPSPLCRPLGPQVKAALGGIAVNVTSSGHLQANHDYSTSNESVL